MAEDETIDKLRRIHNDAVRLDCHSWVPVPTCLDTVRSQDASLFSLPHISQNATAQERPAMFLSYCLELTLSFLTADNAKLSYLSNSFSGNTCPSIMLESDYINRVFLCFFLSLFLSFLLLLFLLVFICWFDLGGWAVLLAWSVCSCGCL